MKRTLATSLAALLIAGTSATAQTVPTPEAAESGLYPGKTYSPYAKRAFPDQVYWGDSHLHTGLSLDAGLFGNITGPKEAWALAKGERNAASKSATNVRACDPTDGEVS